MPGIPLILRVSSIVMAAALAPLPPALARPVQPFAHVPLNVAANCFVESVFFYDQFRERFGDDAWVRVLQWGARENDEVVAGHAVAVFVYREHLWAWDMNRGFLPLDVPLAQREDAGAVAKPILARYPKITPRDPLYRFDFPQAPAENPPAADLLASESEFRDASIVAEKLARHRPVNLVHFSYAVDGETHRGAAAVFLFHGRYCVYSPLKGTVPFHARGSVQNLRLVQEALRRIFPGAFGVESVQ